jgi:hypothetical protein
MVRGIDRVTTATALLKAAIDDDPDAMTALISGAAATNDGLKFSFFTFLDVAHRHPTVQRTVRQIQNTMPAKADQAFTTALLAAKTGNRDLFQAGNVVAQGLVIAALAQGIVADEAAFNDIGETLAAYEG